MVYNIQKPVLSTKISLVPNLREYDNYHCYHCLAYRFRDGLSTLDVIHALEQHPSVFRPYMCYSVDRLTPESLEGVFKDQLSEAGSIRRQEETRILGYCRDYLLDTGDTLHFIVVDYIFNDIPLFFVLFFRTRSMSLRPGHPDVCYGIEFTASFFNCASAPTEF